jgi:hypothetical protein
MTLFPLLLALAAAQAPAATAAPMQALPPAPSRRFNRTFISPMGEPFRPSGRDANTLADWFQQADRNHDGQLTLVEMQQDAERFFAVLDVNRDGEIDPDDITRYETEVAPEIQSGASYGMAALEEGGAGRPRWRGSNANDGHQGGARFGLLDLPEPVVSADFNFNRGVSLAEFKQAAGQRFIALDVDHKGMLTLAVLENIRPAPPPGKQIVRKRPSGEDADTPSSSSRRY